MTDYTSPEILCERRQSGIERKRLLCDACRWCLNRVEGWGAVACKEDGRKYPECRNDDRLPTFDPDIAAIEARKP